MDTLENKRQETVISIVPEDRNEDRERIKADDHVKRAHSTNCELSRGGWCAPENELPSGGWRGPEDEIPKGGWR